MKKKLFDSLYESVMSSAQTLLTEGVNAYTRKFKSKSYDSKSIAIGSNRFSLMQHNFGPIPEHNDPKQLKLLKSVRIDGYKVSDVRVSDNSYSTSPFIDVYFKDANKHEYSVKLTLVYGDTYFSGNSKPDLTLDAAFTGASRDKNELRAFFRRTEKNMYKHIADALNYNADAISKAFEPLKAEADAKRSEQESKGSQELEFYTIPAIRIKKVNWKSGKTSFGYNIYEEFPNATFIISGDHNSELTVFGGGTAIKEGDRVAIMNNDKPHLTISNSKPTAEYPADGPVKVVLNGAEELRQYAANANHMPFYVGSAKGIVKSSRAVIGESKESKENPYSCTPCPECGEFASGAERRRNGNVHCSNKHSWKRESL